MHIVQEKAQEGLTFLKEHKQVRQGIALSAGILIAALILNAGIKHFHLTTPHHLMDSSGTLLTDHTIVMGNYAGLMSGTHLLVAGGVVGGLALAYAKSIWDGDKVKQEGLLERTKQLAPWIALSIAILVVSYFALRASLQDPAYGVNVVKTPEVTGFTPIKGSSLFQQDYALRDTFVKSSQVGVFAPSLWGVSFSFLVPLLCTGATLSAATAAGALFKLMPSLHSPEKQEDERGPPSDPEDLSWMDENNP